MMHSHSTLLSPQKQITTTTNGHDKIIALKKIYALAKGDFLFFILKIPKICLVYGIWKFILSYFS